MSKYQLDDSPIYLNGSDVPKNKLDISDAEVIHEIENDLLIEAYEKFLSELNDDTKFDEEYFINLHKKTFESLYDFAGKYRNENMSKGDSQFCLAEYLDSESKRIFSELQQDKYLTIFDNKEDFAKRLAYYQGELIALHPFYELNGRVLRLFCDLLAVFNGYKPIDYTASIDNEKYIEASIECVQFADTTKLEEIILSGLSS
ncbi:Fic/DOC family protein [Sulfurimonas sp.]|uniref:Fic/DOC family protein n=1 Tax=Sulfurimonas sp. TaxID=2022749 RepID=UPI003D11580A